MARHRRYILFTVIVLGTAIPFTLEIGYMFGKRQAAIDHLINEIPLPGETFFKTGHRPTVDGWWLVYGYSQTRGHDVIAVVPEDDLLVNLPLGSEIFVTPRGTYVPTSIPQPKTHLPLVRPEAPKGA